MVCHLDLGTMLSVTVGTSWECGPMNKAELKQLLNTPTTNMEPTKPLHQPKTVCDYKTLVSPPEKNNGQQAASNPKSAAFPGFYFPKIYLELNKSTLCNP